MAFPTTPLGGKTELQLGSTWTDISGFVNQGTDSIPVTRGHPDESTTTSPSSVGPLTLTNDGRFSLKNPVGAYYPDLVRNVPLRVSVPARSVYLRLEDDAGNASSATCPDSAGVSVTGDLDLRLDFALSGWQTCVLAGKWSPGAGATQSSWLIILNDDGTVTFFWSTTGADFPQAQSTMPLPLRRGCLRVTIDVNNGAGGRTVTFFTGAAGGADGSTWTQLGAAVTQAGTTSIFDSTTAVAVGNYPLNPHVGIRGAVFEFEMRNGIGGTVVARPVFSAQAAGAASFADAQGNTWTLNALAELSGRSYRAHAEATGWPLFTDPSGINLTVQLSANGVLRRISQGQTPAASPMYRAFTRITGTLAPVAYWPMEDGTGATSLASGIGGPPMEINGPVQLAQDSSFPGSLPLPVMNGGSCYGKVPHYSGSGSIICRFLLNVQAAPQDGARLMRVITTGTCTEVSLYYGTGGKLGFAGFNGGGTVFDSGEVAFAINSVPVWVSMELRPGGGTTVNWSIETLTLAGASVGFSGTFTGSIGNAVEAYPAARQQLGQVTIGQVSLQSDWESLFSLGGPITAWQGEAAGSRFARLCGEESLACRIYGPPAVTVPMGVQTQQTISALLQECVDADVGIMYEPSECLGLGYRTQVSLLNQSPALTIAYNQLAEGLAPTLDDQTIVNDVTVTQSGDGSSARQFDTTSSLSVLAPPAGVGTYDTQQQVNVAGDSQLNDQAGWRLHLGTVDEPRYPAVTIDLATTDAGILALFFSVLELRLGDRVVITGPPPWLPPASIDQLVQGVTENIYDHVLNLVLACVPQSPYQVAVLDDVVLGRCDTDGSTLAAAATAGAVLLQVATTDPSTPVWTSVPGDFPFDIAIAGERITATAAAPPGSWLTGQNAGFEGGTGTWVTNANSTLAAFSGPGHTGSGALQLTSVASGSMSAASFAGGSITTQGMPVTPGDTVTASAWFQAAASPRSCVAGAQFYTAAGAFISTLTGSSVTDAVLGWTQATASLTAPATAAFCRAYAQVTATGAAAEVHLVDDVTLGDAALIPAAAQLFVVTRAVNGISKAHLAGEDVRLWTPPILTQV